MSSKEGGIDPNLVVRLNSWQASMSAEIPPKHLRDFLHALDVAFAEKADDAEVDYNNLAELLMQTENIGAEGSSSWRRCCIHWFTRLATRCLIPS